jgi:8-oxo-dGTP pyrophosphatase MutT (NUDIX family)
MIPKASADITCQDHLLVFPQVHFPEAEVQVPSGAGEAEEPQEKAAPWEAREETGLKDL